MALSWLEQEVDRPYHDIAQLFPLMQGEEFEQLKEDIAQNGLHESILLHPDGSIIDGRNRHRACIERVTKPHFRTWDGTGSLVSLVVSMNLHRRHLTSSQRAAIAVGALPLLKAEAKKRQGQRTDLQDFPQFFGESKHDTETPQQAAKIFNTNRQYVSDAEKLVESDPALFEQVKEGITTIPQAKREIAKRQRQESPPLPTGKYRILYADPPWQYSNVGIIGETDNYGHVHRHYPTMSIKELCEMGPQIKQRTEDNAVLFLWVTSPFLESCFHVIKSWGFRYKTSFVWDKIRHNFGHYNSVRHEFLLICTRGSCAPDVTKLLDSVQSIEKSNKHSEKPEEFRAIIDTLYTRGKRLELFARKDNVNGWETVSNEPA